MRGARRIFRVGLILAAILLTAAPMVAAASPLQDPGSTERQLRWRAARSGALSLPLPGTPDVTKLPQRLAAGGVVLGAPLLIRIFKAESELEVWMKKDASYIRIATYPICYWSGTVGPKLREGDRQTPEGLYTITPRQLHHGGRWRRSLDIGYPNAFDRAHRRTGSAILVHGGCDSTGCFAMTDPVNAELYDLVAAALEAGARHVPVHVFPFRMTDTKLGAAPAGPWTTFWSDLKQAYDTFERTHLPPHVSVCAHRYHVRAATGADDVPGPVALCPEDRSAIASADGTDAETEESMSAEAAAAAKAPPPPCSMTRASCRKWVALRDRRSASRTIAVHGNQRSRVR